MESRVRAIVFDANVFGKAVKPNVVTISRWATACADHEAELWVPEIVAWELAQRVIEETESFVESFRTHSRNRRQWGLGALRDVETVTEWDVINGITEAGAVIVETPPDVALEALRDQVLLRGPAARKRDVKTGAADSAWVRAVIARNGGDATGLLVVSGDKEGVLKTCDEIGSDPPQIAAHLGEIADLLEATRDASGEQAAQFASAATEAFESGGDQDLISFLDLSRTHWWSVGSSVLIGEGWEHQESFLGQTYPAVVVSPVMHDAWSESLTGSIEITAEVEEQYARQDDFGDHPEYAAIRYIGKARCDVSTSATDEHQPLVLNDYDSIALSVEPESLHVSPL